MQCKYISLDFSAFPFEFVVRSVTLVRARDYLVISLVATTHSHQSSLKVITTSFEEESNSRKLREKNGNKIHTCLYSSSIKCNNGQIHSN